MTAPKMLLIDSPAIGLAPALVDRVYDSILSMRDDGISVLLVEQNAAMALALSDYVYVLHRGRVVLEGVGADLRESQAVIDAYLG
jgi:branched-chain amino acid transport system ATP-binding protein